jgi:hypothetical protein
MTLLRLRTYAAPNYVGCAHKQLTAIMRASIADTGFILSADVFMPSEGVRIFNFEVIIKPTHKKI